MAAARQVQPMPTPVRGLRAHSTSDIRLETLQELVGELESGGVHVEVETSQRFYRSALPPSWIAFLGTPEWWVSLVAGDVILTATKHAAKGAWKNRGRVVSAVGALAKGLASLRIRIEPRTAVQVGLPIPNEHDGTQLRLDGADEGDIELQLLLFLYHLPKLLELIKSERLDSGAAAGPVWLTLKNRGDLDVAWQDAETFEARAKTLHLRP